MKTTKYYFSHLFLALTLVFSLGFVSCSDDDENVGSKEDLIGTWECIHYEVTEIEDGEKHSYTDELTWKVKFNEDGTGTEYGYYNFEWSYKGNKLRLIYDDDPDDRETYTVKTLNTTQLIMELHYKDKEDGIVYESKEIFTLKKIHD